MLFRGGGGNVYNVVLRVNAATLRGLISFILCLLYKIPPWGEGSIASSRPIRPEPATPLPRVKHSTTKPLCSLYARSTYYFTCIR